LRDVIAEGWLRRCVLIGVGVAMCNQLAGVNSIMYYGTDILAKNGLGRDAALIANIANGVSNKTNIFLSIFRFSSY